MNHYGSPSSGFEQRSSATLFGLPLVHTVAGKDPFTGKRRVACGIVGIGQFAFGVVSISQAGAGVVVLSQFAPAVLFGLGQFIVAPAAIGQFAATIFGAVGQFAIGFATLGQFAVSPGDTAIGQATVNLGEGPMGLALGCIPAVLGWLIAAKVLTGLGRNDPRSRHAVALPASPVCSTAAIQSGQVVLRARVAAGQGVVFEATDEIAAPDRPRKLRTPEFEVEDEHGKATVRAGSAMLYVAGRGHSVCLREGDIVEIEGTAHLTAHPDGVRIDYRQPPARWTIEARTLAGNQSIRTVRAMARFPALLGWLMAVAAVVTTAALVAANTLR